MAPFRIPLERLSQWLRIATLPETSASIVDVLIGKAIAMASDCDFIHS